MTKVWIYYLIFLLKLKLSCGDDIFININMDYLPTETELTIYNKTVPGTNCSFIKNRQNSVVLLIERNLTTVVCDAGNIKFKIFVYYTNITSAIVTIENTNTAYDEIEKNFPKFFILKNHTNYISFVICNVTDSGCRYSSVNQREVIINKLTNKQKVYSACSGINGLDPCLTIIEFKTAINYNGPIIGTTINVINSNMNNDHVTTVNCHNEGTKISGTEKCQCRKSDAFVKHGPQCEALQQKLSETQYLYVLPNSQSLQIDFSLASPAQIGGTEILRIRSSNNYVLQYIIYEGIHQILLNTSNIYTSNITYPLDSKRIWVDISLNITTTKLTFKVNENETNINLALTDFLKLDTYPLILHGGVKNEIVSICISNLEVNSQVVDLYTPSYKDCIEGRCDKCAATETCFEEFFTSRPNVKCVCKTGFDNCKNLNITKQIYNGQESIRHVTKTNIKLVTFRFRTLSDSGSLVQLFLQQSLSYILSIGISSGRLTWKIDRLMNTSNIFPYNKVSNGEWHQVDLHLTKYQFKITLDENLYTAHRIWFDANFRSNSDPEISKFIFGPLQSSQMNPSNFSTCFDTFIVINDLNVFVPMISLFQEFDEGCNDGINCSKINCGPFKKCEESWQNSSCRCQTEFKDINGSCVFNKCFPNPCNSKGECHYSVLINDFYCNCTIDFRGKYCEVNIKERISWWVYLIIGLLLLCFILVTLLLIIICCCCLRSKKALLLDIGKVYENTVAYSDQAGEVDYCGPPINLDLIKKYMNFEKPVSIDLTERKLKLDLDNEDLAIDQPLEYRYEGFEKDNLSISSLGSGSTDEELNILPIINSKDGFRYLKSLYK